jgi:hypothetical protein
METVWGKAPCHKIGMGRRVPKIPAVSRIPNVSDIFGIQYTKKE